MNVQDVINIFRQRADDGVFPYHVSDETLVGFFAEAESEACQRALLIFDETSDFCTIPVATDIVRYELDPSIFRVDCVQYTTTAGVIFNLEEVGIDAISGSDVTIKGRPLKYNQLGDNALAVWPVPNAYADGVLNLRVYRTPVYPVEELDDEFEIAERHHANLIDWVLYRTYMSKDIEIYDPRRAETALADFIRNFGERRNADVKRRHREKRPVTVKYAGY